MKKSPGTSKKLFRKIPVIPLPSGPGPAAVGARIGYAKLVIDATGTLNPPPAKIDVNTGDAVGWLVINNSDKDVKIKNKKFKRQNVELSPIAFVTERVTAEKNGGTAFIFGFVVHLPADAAQPDDIKYTVEVRGKKDADYDPDLIIRRPPV